MQNKQKVLEKILEANPKIDLAELKMYEDYVAWVCPHGMKHIIYTEDGSPFYSPDECGNDLSPVDPIEETGVKHCRDCGTLTPQEIMEDGRCPICAEYA